MLGLKGKCKRRKYRSYQGEVGKIADNLLQRNFHASAPNQKWGTDVTELKCVQGNVYFSPIKYLFNWEIIAYDVARQPNFEQISRMMKQASARLNGAMPILHSVTKAGNIKWRATESCVDKMALHPVCQEKEIT